MAIGRLQRTCFNGKIRTPRFVFVRWGIPSPKRDFMSMTCLFGQPTCMSGWSHKMEAYFTITIGSKDTSNIHQKKTASQRHGCTSKFYLLKQGCPLQRHSQGFITSHNELMLTKTIIHFRRVIREIRSVYMAIWFLVSTLCLQCYAFEPCTLPLTFWFQFFDRDRFSAAKSVLDNNETIVIGPTPPGTGVIQAHFGATSS